MQEQIEQARQLVKEKRYPEARRLLASINHPKQAEWLAKIDALERENKGNAQIAQPMPASTTTSLPKTTKVKTSKPLPLLPEEERQVLKRGKPVNPRDILEDKVDMGKRARAWIWLFGGKSGALINNYHKMNKTLYGIIFLIIYFIWFVAWFPCLGFALVLIQRLLNTGSTNFLVLIISLAVIGLLPFSPNIIAWVQQEQYQAWVKQYAKIREDYLAGKS